MLSDQEKREMLEDAKNAHRKAHFRFAKRWADAIGSIDDFIVFLDSIQKIFTPFEISRRSTPTRNNKL